MIQTKTWRKIPIGESLCFINDELTQEIYFKDPETNKIRRERGTFKLIRVERK